jgi:hypothetical protein
MKVNGATDVRIEHYMQELPPDYETLYSQDVPSLLNLLKSNYPFCDEINNDISEFMILLMAILLCLQVVIQSFG